MVSGLEGHRFTSSPPNRTLRSVPERGSPWNAPTLGEPQLKRILRPRVIVTLGATSGLAVFGKPTPIGEFRGQAIQLPDQAQGVVTYRPSYLLRVPDADAKAKAKAKAYAMFVEDLKFAWKLAG